MWAMRSSFAWPHARPAKRASDNATIDVRSFMNPPGWLLRILFCTRDRLGPPADGDGGVDVVSLPLEPELRRLPRREGGDQVEHAGGIGHGLALHLDQHVAGLDAALVGGAAAQHARDERAARVA